MAGTSTTFSRAACSRAMSMAISVPVLPTPALQGEMVDLSLLWQSPTICINVLYRTIFNPSWPAMHQCGSSEELLNSTEVVEDWSSILWNTMVWPGGEVELGHLQLVSSTPFTLHGEEKSSKLKGRQVTTKTFTAVMCIESINTSLNSQRQTAVGWCSLRTPAGLWEWLWTDRTPWSPALASNAHTYFVPLP